MRNFISRNIYQGNFAKAVDSGKSFLMSQLICFSEIGWTKMHVQRLCCSIVENSVPVRIEVTGGLDYLALRNTLEFLPP